MTRIGIILSLACCLTAPGVAGGVELRLKSQVRCTASIVRLGDVAEIHAAEAWQVEQLAAVELGPAPTTGGRRFLRGREIQDALFVRGFNQAEHRLSGSDQIEILGPGEPVIASAAPPTRQFSNADRERTKRMIVEAITLHLNGKAGRTEPWSIAVAATEEQLAPLCGSARRVSADGGTAPYLGRQQFVVTTDDASAAAQPLLIEADVTLPPAVVAVARHLSAGTILHESDLILKPVAAVNERQQPFYRVDDVLGMETIVSLPAGAILGRANIRRPVVVRRGDPVTLYARAAGLRVRTTVRSKDDGSLGDLVAVESLANRETFYARVTGIQEVEVYAAPAEAKPRARGAADARFAAPGTLTGGR